MNYFQKVSQWKQKILNGKGDNLELLFQGNQGNWEMKQKFGCQTIDCFYFCMLDNGKRVVDIFWENKGDTSTTE